MAFSFSGPDWTCLSKMGKQRAKHVRQASPEPCILPLTDQGTESAKVFRHPSDINPMTEIISSFARTEKVLPGKPIARQPHPLFAGRTTNVFSTKTCTLDYLFQDVVIQETRWAWYVDHFTIDPGQFNVFYLSSDPLIKWTNENMDERDPDDPDNTEWGSDDVATWFSTQDEGGSSLLWYEHVVYFHSGGSPHRLLLAAHNVTLDGADRWAEYVKFGVKGAIGSLVDTFDHLDNIEVYSA